MDNGNQPIELLALQDAAKGTRRKVGLLKSRAVRVSGRPKGIVGFRPTRRVESEVVEESKPVATPGAVPRRSGGRGLLLDPRTPLT